MRFAREARVTQRTALHTQRTIAAMTKPTDNTSRRSLSRRQILKATAGTAALLAAAKLNFPAGAFAEGALADVQANERVVEVYLGR